MCAKHFPTSIRGSCTAIVIMISQILGDLAPKLSHWSIQIGLHPIVGCSIYLIFAIPFALFIEETLVNENVDSKINDNNTLKISQDVSTLKSPNDS